MGRAFGPVWKVAFPILSLVGLVVLAGAVPAGAAGAAKVLSFVDGEGHVVRTKVLADPYQVQLRTGTVDLRQAGTKALAAGTDRVPLIVAFDSAPSSRLTASLAAAGAQVVGTLPPMAYMVRADAETAAVLAKLEGFAAMARFQDRWKVTERVALDGKETAVDVVLFAQADHRLALKAASLLGEVDGVFQVLDRVILRAVLKPKAIRQMASLPDVEMIDAVSHGGMMNNQIRVVLQTEKQHFTANQAFYNPIYNIGVFGAGQVVTAADSGLEDHEVYAAAGKIVANDPALGSCVAATGDEVNHGSGVAATLLGDKIGASGLFGTANDYDGLALQAALAMQDIEDETDFCPPMNFASDLFVSAWQSGSMVHNNSWGHNAGTNGPGGTYSWRSQMIDKHMSDETYREQVIVFAAGNAGASYPGGVYRPFTLSDETHSKNAIAVGGSGNGTNRDFMYLYSSRGPTNDCDPNPCDGLQRVKPDVLAPATWAVDTADTANYSAYSPFSGTSIAAPAISAAAALIRDYFAQGIYPVRPTDPPLRAAPSSALIKAMLVNATVPIYDATGYEGNSAQNLAADAYPNYDQGYGRPVLDNVLEPAGYRELRVYENETTYAETSTVWERSVRFAEKWGASCSHLRVTLAWNDPPAALQAGPKLVNDLDLEVSFGGTTYMGNHRLTGNLAYDKANNVEDVFLPMTPRGLGNGIHPVVRVYGSSVPVGPQPFAVVVTYGACADNLPCDPPQGAGGCYRGPGDVVPGSSWAPVPGCADQVYSSSEYGGTGSPYPFCEPPTICGDATKQEVMSPRGDQGGGFSCPDPEPL